LFTNKQQINRRIWYNMSSWSLIFFSISFKDYALICISKNNSMYKYNQRCKREFRDWKGLQKRKEGRFIMQLLWWKNNSTTNDLNPSWICLGPMEFFISLSIPDNPVSTFVLIKCKFVQSYSWTYAMFCTPFVKF